MRFKMNSRVSFSAKTPHVTDAGKSSDDKRKNNKDDRRFSKTRSATNSPYYLQETSQATEQGNGGCVGNKRADNCCYKNSNKQIPVSHVNKCDERCHGHKPVHVKKKDNDSQVSATDIQPSVGIQTSPSLSRRTGELPPRNPNRIRELISHKHPVRCDCEQSPSEPTKRYVQEGTQTEAWLVSSLEYAQTGPSLTAVGPFSRFDYRLKRAKLPKDDAYLNCCQVYRPIENTACSSKKWFLCPSIDLQVSALDISVSELLQTEDPTMPADENERVICASCLSQTPNKVHTLTDCEYCSDHDGTRTAKSTKGFSAQVDQENISPSKCTQTDPCLWVDICKTARLYPSANWICGFRKICQLFPRIPRKPGKDFSQQVTATDIGITEETQTCLHLMLAKPFCPACSQLATCRCSANHRVLTSRAMSFQMDRCDACSTEPKVRTALNAGTQVKLSDTSFSKEQQTSEDNIKRRSSYIRSGQWASKTWN